MNSEEVIIHEFSTGIQVELLEDGSWQSRGFISQYINATLSPIPKAVNRAIANQLFAVVEGTESDEPAMVGREVYDQQSGEWWSVVALASRGSDEKGRPISVYRYFLTEGKGNIRKILVRFDIYKEKIGKLPVFNPRETKTLNIPTKFFHTRPQNFKPMPENVKDNIVVHLPPEYTWHDINHLASQKAGENTAAWAYHVKALENPGNFNVIQAASIPDLKNIKSAINSLSAIVPVTLDESRIKSIIKTLMNNSTINPEAARAIFSISKDPQMTPAIWHKLFNGEGADKAVSKDINSPQFARLLTLRALLIKETIIEWRGWLSNKPELVESAITFQNSFIEYLRNAEGTEELLYAGFLYCFEQFWEEQLSVDEFAEILRFSGENSWKKYFNYRGSDPSIDGRYSGHKLYDRRYLGHKLYEILKDREPDKDGDDDILYQVVKGLPKSKSSGESTKPTSKSKPQPSTSQSPVSASPDNMDSFLAVPSYIHSIFNNLPNINIFDQLPKHLKKKALDDYQTTIDSLREIYEEIKKRTSTDDISIQQSIIKTVFKKKNVNYEFIFNRQISPKTEDKLILGNAIYRYRKSVKNKNSTSKNKNSTSTLSITYDQITCTILMDDCIFSLRENTNIEIFQKEMDKARNDFDEITRQSLHKIYDSFKDYPNINDDIKNALGFQNSLNFEIIRDKDKLLDPSDDKNKDQWIIAIAKFQFSIKIKSEENYGVIEKDKKTYQELQNQLVNLHKS